MGDLLSDRMETVRSITGLVDYLKTLCPYLDRAQICDQISYDTKSKWKSPANSFQGGERGSYFDNVCLWHWPVKKNSKPYVWGRKLEILAVRRKRNIDDENDSIVGFLVLRSFTDEYWEMLNEREEGEGDEKKRKKLQHKWRFYEFDKVGGLCMLNTDKVMAEELLRRCPDNEFDLSAIIMWIIYSLTIDEMDAEMMSLIPEDLCKMRGCMYMMCFNTMPEAVNAIVRNQMKFTGFVAALMLKQGKLNTRMGRRTEFWGTRFNDPRLRPEDAEVLIRLVGMPEEEHKDVNEVWPQYWVDIRSLTTIHGIRRDKKGKF